MKTVQWKILSTIAVIWHVYAVAESYSLVIAAIFKDEAPYFLEWIEYHKMMGVQHFRLYDNDSTDDYLSVLAPYIAAGEVTVIHWPSSEEDLKDWPYRTQWSMCRDAIVYFQEKSAWLALIDVDEFLLPLEDNDMTSFLTNYEEYPEVVLSWQCFGTSNVQEIPEGRTLLETLIWKAEEFSVRNLPPKSIVRPKCVNVSKIAWVPHTYHYCNNRLAVFPDGTEREETWDMNQWEVRPYKAVINHYIHRTEKFFWEKKIGRKRRMENGGDFLTPEYIEKWRADCNAIIDNRIMRFVPELQRRLRELSLNTRE